MKVAKQDTFSDKIIAFTANILVRVIEVWVVLVILNWLGIMPT